MKNSTHQERYINETPTRQFSILINDSDLREMDLHEIQRENFLYSKHL